MGAKSYESVKSFLGMMGCMCVLVFVFYFSIFSFSMTLNIFITWDFFGWDPDGMLVYSVVLVGVGGWQWGKSETCPKFAFYSSVQIPYIFNICLKKYMV